jgi:ankyrin repeat protein
MQAQTGTASEIHKAVIAGDINKVRFLVDADSSLLELKDNKGRTPLILCFDGFTIQLAIAKFLIEKGANVNAKSNNGLMPMLGASARANSYEPDFDLIQRLIAKGADVNVKNNRGNTPLLLVASVGDPKVAKLLIDNGADVNACGNGPFGSSVLQNAIIDNSNEGMSKLLVETGAKLNQKDNFGNTELHLAAMRGFADVIWPLVKHGADINAVNENNHTPLYYAAKYGYRYAADALIAAGANKSTAIETNYGKAPQLSARLKQGEAYLWYVEGGYAVKTINHLFLFCGPIVDQSLEAGLANGHLNPKELVDQKITMFAPYPADEFFKSFILKVAKRMPEVNWVFTTPNKKVDSLDIRYYRLIGPNESLYMGDVQIHTIPGVIGGNQSMAYLVEADKVKVFNGTSYLSTNKASEVEKYHNGIDSLKPFGPIDIAILRVGTHFGNTYEPYLYLIDQLLPKAVYLMGGDNNILYDEYPKCTNLLQTRNIQVKYPETRIADRFHYLRDSMQK